VVFPGEATLKGTLAQINGDPVPGAVLAVQALGKSGWRDTWQASTGTDGSFSLSVATRLSHQLRVLFAGDPARLPSTSPPVRLTVRQGLWIVRQYARTPVCGVRGLT